MFHLFIPCEPANFIRATICNGFQIDPVSPFTPPGFNNSLDWCCLNERHKRIEGDTVTNETVFV